MRKESLLVICLSILLCISCGESKKSAPVDEPVIDEIHMSVAKQDTADVMYLAKTFTNALKMKDIDYAMSMLYYLDKDSIKAMPSSLAQMQRSILNRFSGKEYRIEFMQFNRETDSKVKFYVSLDSVRGPESNPNEIGFILRPVRREGKWYLTTDDTMTEKNPSEI